MGKNEKDLIDFLNWYIEDYDGDKEDTVEMIVYEYLEKDKKGGENNARRSRR